MSEYQSTRIKYGCLISYNIKTVLWRRSYNIICSYYIHLYFFSLLLPFLIYCSILTLYCSILIPFLSLYVFFFVISAPLFIFSFHSFFTFYFFYPFYSWSLSRSSPTAVWRASARAWDESGDDDETPQRLRRTRSKLGFLFSPFSFMVSLRQPLTDTRDGRLSAAPRNGRNGAPGKWVSGGAGA